MKRLTELQQKKKLRVVGLMSGTSVDGIDAALVELDFSAAVPKVRLLAFENRPFPEAVRKQIFELFDRKQSTVEKIGYMNFLLGELYAKAVLHVIAKSGAAAETVDLIGSHGQTIWHAPVPDAHDGIPVSFTMQIGEGAVIAERTGIVTVSDFRVADMAAGGQGAPLVPFTEYLLYRREGETLLLQNIGGIGNMTVLPERAGTEHVFAFDTGPGNMVIDAMTAYVTDGKQQFDEGGRLAAEGTVCEELLAELMADPYYTKPLPKTTGREHYDSAYMNHVKAKAKRLQVSGPDLLRTVTELTACSIAESYHRYVLPSWRASELIAGGGGSYNRTLMAALKKRMEAFGVKTRIQEELGYSSDAKEAVAFALLAGCCIREESNTLPTVTGARHPAVMGKISLPYGSRRS